MSDCAASPLPLSRPVLLLAGRGDLPRRVAERCVADGRPLHVIVMRDQGDAAAFADLNVPVTTLRLGQGGTALAYLRRHDIRDLVMAGGVRRPSLLTLWPDALTARFLARVGMRTLGDDGLLRAIIQEMEAYGLTVHPVEVLLNDAVGGSGVLGRHAPDETAWRDIHRGWEVAAALGAADVGQSVVVQQGLVLGVEAVEGTDALIERAGHLKQPGPGGVLVKRCKPGQDRRVDLPTIGPKTVDRARTAGLRGIAYEAGVSLLLAPDLVRDKADRAGLFVIGVAPSDLARGPGLPDPVPAPPTDIPDGGSSAPGEGARGGEDVPGEAPLVYLIAGEPSGDALAARLMAALRERLRGHVRFAGVGGEAMAEQGLETLIDQRELAIMGFLEVLPRVMALRRRLREVVADVQARRPAVVVTVDSWGFTGRVAAALKACGSTVPRLHYVAPMVWAWKEKRKHAVADRVDHLMTLWPFECAYFLPLGLACTHVGHAVIESGAAGGDGQALRDRLGIPASAPVLVVLPGSRSTEVRRLLPVFGDVVGRLARARPNLHVVVPTVATVANPVTEAVKTWPVPSHVVRGSGQRHDAFAAASAALAASGTVSLELAVANVPHLIAYRVNPVTAALFRRMTRLRFAGPVNILMDRMIVPEFLQQDCRADRLAPALAALLDGGPDADTQRRTLAEARDRLTAGADGLPSVRAAEVVTACLTHGRA